MLAESELIREGDEDLSEPLLNTRDALVIWRGCGWRLPSRPAKTHCTGILNTATGSRQLISLIASFPSMGTSGYIESYLARGSSTSSTITSGACTLTTLFSLHPIYTPSTQKIHRNSYRALSVNMATSAAGTAQIHPSKALGFLSTPSLPLLTPFFPPLLAPHLANLHYSPSSRLLRL